VDHLLDFAHPLLQDFSGLDRDQLAERGFASTQFLTEEAYKLAALWRRDHAPNVERRVRSVYCAFAICLPIRPDLRDKSAANRRADSKPAPGQGGFGDAQFRHEATDAGSAWQGRKKI